MIAITALDLKYFREKLKRATTVEARAKYQKQLDVLLDAAVVYELHETHRGLYENIRRSSKRNDV